MDINGYIMEKQQTKTESGTKEVSRKFLQTVGISTWRKLRSYAQSKEIPIQEVIRGEIIPDWLKQHPELDKMVQDWLDKQKQEKT